MINYRSTPLLAKICICFKTINNVFANATLKHFCTLDMAGFFFLNLPFHY